MKEIKGKNYNISTIIIFPYLYLENGLEMEGLKINTSDSKFIDAESEFNKDILNIIIQFFLEGNKQSVTKFSYITTPLPYIKRYYGDWRDLIGRIRNIQTLIRFYMMIRHDLNIYFSHFNFFIFTLDRTRFYEKHDLKRFFTTINGQGSHYFFIEYEKVINPLIQLMPHYPIIINENDQKIIIEEYYLMLKFFMIPDEYDRVLKAMDWFNRSLVMRPEIDRCEAVINMTIAFESLFKIKEGERSVKEHLKNNICNLLGNMKGLAEWIDNFWELRNQIVHGDRKSSIFLYKAPESKFPHQDHLYMARIIFKECIKALIILRKNLRPFAIQEELISNEQRMKNALRLLKSAKYDIRKASDNGALTNIQELRKTDTAPSIKDSIRFGKIFLDFVIRYLNRTDATQDYLAKILLEITKYDQEKLDVLIDLYQRAYDVKPWHFINREDYSNENKYKIELGLALEEFMEYMDNRWTYYELQKQG